MSCPLPWPLTCQMGRVPRPSLGEARRPWRGRHSCCNCGLVCVLGHVAWVREPQFFLGLTNKATCVGSSRGVPKRSHGWELCVLPQAGGGPVPLSIAAVKRSSFLEPRGVQSKWGPTLRMGDLPGKRRRSRTCSRSFPAGGWGPPPQVAHCGAAKGLHGGRVPAHPAVPPC